jgi:hypothetical protein
MLTRQVSMLAIFGLLPPSFVIGETVTLKQLETEQEGIKLIHQVRDLAREVQYHAEQLNYVTGATQISKRTQPRYLDQIKSQVNEGLRPEFKRLTEIQPQLPARHLVIIDQMLASAKALAAGTNPAIRNQNSDGVVNNPYVELIININKHADALANISNAAADYGTAHRQAAETGLNAPLH